MQSFFLVADDMMDQSTTRRGKDCWHLKDGIGLHAINDSILLESCVYTLLDKHFGQKSFYLNILDAFIYVSLVKMWKVLPTL
jgi:farnesyl diphosphate synthase